MLKELQNIRSYQDLVRALEIIKNNLHAVSIKADKIKSTSAGKFTVGKEAGVPKVSNDISKATLPDKVTFSEVSELAKSITEFYAIYDDLVIVKHTAQKEFGNFKSQPGLLESATVYMKEVLAKIKISQARLNELTKTFIPPHLKALFKIVNAYLAEKFTPDCYSNLVRGTNAFPIKYKGKAGIEYLYVTAHFKYSNLKLRPDNYGKSGKQTDFAYSTFSIVLTARIHMATSKTDYHITAMPEFKVPGSYKLPDVTVTESNVIDALTKEISTYNFAAFHDRTVVPAKDEITKSKIKGVKKIKILNDRISLMLEPGLSDSDTHGAIATVQAIINKAFKGLVNFRMNQDRGLDISHKVRVAETDLDSIEPFTGKIKMPTLNSEEAKIALNNPLETFLIWYDNNIQSHNAGIQKKIARKDQLLKELNTSEWFDKGHIVKGAPAAIKLKYDIYHKLDSEFKSGTLRELKASSGKVKYNAYIKDGLTSDTIKEAPEANKVEVRKERHPIIHIELEGKKLSPADTRKYQEGLRNFNAFCDEYKLDPQSKAEVKKIFFKV